MKCHRVFVLNDTNAFSPCFLLLSQLLSPPSSRQQSGVSSSQSEGSRWAVEVKSFICCEVKSGASLTLLQQWRHNLHSFSFCDPRLLFMYHQAPHVSAACPLTSGLLVSFFCPLSEVSLIEASSSWTYLITAARLFLHRWTQSYCSWADSHISTRPLSSAGDVTAIVIIVLREMFSTLSSANRSNLEEANVQSDKQPSCSEK